MTDQDQPQSSAPVPDDTSARARTDVEEGKGDWLDGFVESKLGEVAAAKGRLDARVAARQQRAWSGEAGAEGAGAKAGRNLPAAIASGLVLAALLIAAMVFRKELYLLIAGIGVGAASWELRQALTQAGFRVPLVPAILGTPVMLLGAYLTGGHGLTVAFGATMFLGAMWRVADPGPGLVRDISGSFFIAAYPNLLAGFSALLLAPADGAARLFVYLLVTTFSDIGGYAFGVLFGKHPLAPSVSPKKSWEGFIGSAVTCMILGALSVSLALHAPWQWGVLLGLLVALGATLGDLFESLIKRDLGIKDMSSLLPGHGGFMDRIDSLVVTAPLVWVVLTLAVPVGGS